MTDPAANPNLEATGTLAGISGPTVAKAATLGVLKTLGTAAAVAAAVAIGAHDYVGALIGAGIAIASLAAYEKL